MTAPLLSLRDLTITFGANAATHNVSFDIAPGETVALVGESGSGKSVTALSILKLLPPPAALWGDITFKGQNLLAVSDAELRAVRGNDISMIFQEPMTSLDFLGLGLPVGSPSLGELLAQGKNNLQAPWLGLTGFFTVAIMMTLLVFIGEGVRDAFDPRKTPA